MFTAADWAELYLRNSTRSAWVAEPTERGTFSILSSAFFTMVLCVWTCVHIDVYPTSRNIERILYKVVWTLIAIISPATVALQAIGQRRDAKRLLTKVKGLPESRAKSLGLDGAFLIVSGGVTYRSGTSDLIIITPVIFVKLCEANLVGDLRGMHTELNHRSKADNISRGLVILQLAHAYIDLIGRGHAGLPVTLLEIHVVIHSLCAVFMYLTWWHKAYGVTCPIILQITEPNHPDLLRSPTTVPTHPSAVVKAIITKQFLFFNHRLSWGSAVPLLGFSVVHACTWNRVYFTTEVECLLWRSASIAVAVPALACLPLWPEPRGPEGARPEMTLSEGPALEGAWWRVVYGFMAGLYIICLGCLLIESIITLRNPPLGTFRVVPWMTYLPHF